jgi:putative ABC transport system substrate-binding protein
MKRREFITFLGSTVIAWPLAAGAQQPVMPVIGYLSARTPKTDAPLLGAFRRGLSEAGYVEGNNVTMEFRWSGGQLDPLSELAADLVRRRVSVIVTVGGPPPALAAKAATATIPIVFVTAGDPVQEGLVASLSRPGGNVTGVYAFYFSLGPKQLGLMRALLPNADFFGLLVDPRIASAESQANETEAAGRAMGQRFLVLSQNGTGDRRGLCDARSAAGWGAPRCREPILLHPGALPHHFGGPPFVTRHVLPARIGRSGRPDELWDQHC